LNVFTEYDKDGKLYRTKTISRDITELKKAEEAIKRKNNQLNTFINSISDMAWFKDTDSNFVIVNKAFGEAVGMNPEYLVNNSCEICFGTEAAKKFKEDDQKVMKSRRRVVFEESILNMKGDKVILETIKAPLFAETGKISGTIGVARDITERKQMEKALKESEIKFRTLFEDSRDALYISSREGRFLDVNRSLLELFGYTKKEMLKSFSRR
jgi:PAS domain S-box-containing protein